MKQQSSHWYRASNSKGFTANPLFAAPGEIERVGLHVCETQGCQEAHCGEAKEFVNAKILAAESRG